MTSIYFVRHAQPQHDWEDNRTRPLTEEGMNDCEKVTAALCNVQLDYAVTSPYKRSRETIMQCAQSHQLEIHMDERLRERQKGENGNTPEMFEKRWTDFDYHEVGGESLGEVQKRNIEALTEILQQHEGENVLIGTHGTALSTILNYYDSNYDCKSFLRIIDYMPYIIRLDFEGLRCVGQEELLIVEKEFKGKKCDR